MEEQRDWSKPLKGPSKKYFLHTPSRWDPVVWNVLHGCKHRSLASGLSLNELLYGVISRARLRHLASSSERPSACTARLAETLSLASFLVPHAFEMSAKIYCGPIRQKLGVGDYVLIVRGRASDAEMRELAFSVGFTGLVWLSGRIVLATFLNQLMTDACNKVSIFVDPLSFTRAYQQLLLLSSSG